MFVSVLIVCVDIEICAISRVLDNDGSKKKAVNVKLKLLHEGLGAWGPSARQIYWGLHIGHMKPSAFDAP